MIAKQVNLKMVRGDTQKIGIKIKGLHESPTAIYFSLKKNISDTNYILQKTLDEGIVQEQTGKYIIKLTPQDTESLAATTYQFDFEVTFGEDVVTLVIGTLELIADVTRHLEGGE